MNIKEITLCLLASLCMTMHLYANNGSTQFKAEIVQAVNSIKGKEEIRLNFSSLLASAVRED